jgi:hypothetical protein
MVTPPDKFCQVPDEDSTASKLITSVSSSPVNAGICIDEAIGLLCAILYLTAKFAAVKPVNDEMFAIGMLAVAVPDEKVVVLTSV